MFLTQYINSEDSIYNEAIDRKSNTNLLCKPQPFTYFFHKSSIYLV